MRLRRACFRTPPSRRRCIPKNRPIPRSNVQPARCRWAALAGRMNWGRPRCFCPARTRPTSAGTHSSSMAATGCDEVTSCPNTGPCHSKWLIGACASSWAPLLSDEICCGQKYLSSSRSLREKRMASGEFDGGRTGTCGAARDPYGSDDRSPVQMIYTVGQGPPEPSDARAPK